MTNRRLRGLLLAAAIGLGACGGGGKGGSGDGGAGGGGGAGGPDLGCVMNPKTGTDILNACTSAQTGDPAKDAPYFPSLTPGGKLPNLP